MSSVNEKFFRLPKKEEKRELFGFERFGIMNSESEPPSARRIIMKELRENYYKWALIHQTLCSTSLRGEMNLPGEIHFS
jgi:hypothetical protein